MADFEIIDEFVDIHVEDELTKAVFGCLQLLGPEALNEIFSDERFDFSFESAPEFTFHETVDKREPDVIIEDGDNLTVMVEAKVNAPTDTTQLVDEYADLKEGWDSETLRLLHVTKDRLRPSKLSSITEIPSEELIWTNWRNIASAALNVDASRVSTADRRVIEMLIEVFEAEGYTPFGGFTLMNQSNSLGEQLNQAYRVREQYYDDINSFRKDVETYLTEDIEYWRFFRRGVSGGQGSGLVQFPTSNYQRLPRNLWFSYIPQSKSTNLAHTNYNENYLFLDFNSKTGQIRAGYSVTTASGKVSDDIFRRTLHERKDTVLRIVEENDFHPFTVSYSMGNRIDSLEDLPKFLDEIGVSSYDDSELGRRFLLTRVWSAEELSTRDEGDNLFEPVDLTRDVAGVLDEIHRLTYREHPEIFYPTVE